MSVTLLVSQFGRSAWFTQPEAPTAEYFPASHRRHCDTSVSPFAPLLEVPAGHGVQISDSAWSEYLPASQTLQLLVLTTFSSWYLPDSQTSHARRDASKEWPREQLHRLELIPAPEPEPTHILYVLTRGYLLIHAWPQRVTVNLLDSLNML